MVPNSIPAQPLIISTEGCICRNTYAGDSNCQATGHYLPERKMQLPAKPQIRNRKDRRKMKSQVKKQLEKLNKELPQIEYLVIESSRKGTVLAPKDAEKVRGYIPRKTAEKLLGRDLGGVEYFTEEESQKMREHPDWRLKL